MSVEETSLDMIGDKKSNIGGKLPKDSLKNAQCECLNNSSSQDANKYSLQDVVATADILSTKLKESAAQVNAIEQNSISVGNDAKLLVHCLDRIPPRNYYPASR